MYMNKELNLLMLTSLGTHCIATSETRFSSSVYRASAVDEEDEYKFEEDDEDDDSDDEDEDDDYDDEDDDYDDEEEDYED